MDPYLGQIMMFAGTFAPQGWAFCNGQLLAVQQNAALFSILGTTYGGNGTSTFALPNLQGRVPVHAGNLAGGQSYTLGQLAGTENVTLLSTQMPQHTHVATGGNQASANPADQTSPVGNVPAVTNTGGGRGAQQYPAYTAAAGATGNLGGNGPTLGAAGGNQPHSNLQPFAVINFIIALTGVYPQRP